MDRSERGRNCLLTTQLLLREAGFGPSDVTDILLTHIHTDHSGGLMRDDQRVFQNATIHVGKPDVTFFLNRSNAANAHYDIKYFDEAIRTVKPYLDAGKVNAFDRTTTILPNLVASLHPDHTPGSAFFTLTSGNETIQFVGDIIHVAAIQFPDPSVAIVYDVNPTAAVANRRFRNSYTIEPSSPCRICRSPTSGMCVRLGRVSSGCRSRT